MSQRAHFDLSGQRALVTGAGQGIGAAIVTRLAEAGAEVTAANRTLKHAEELAATLTARGLKVVPAGFDDLSRGGLKALVDGAAARGGLDILVHNAGGCPWSTLEALDEAKLEAAFALNLTACFWLAQAAIPYMRARGGGRILVTSSVTGPRSAMVGASHYAAAKAGVNGFIRNAALELARDAITVNGVEPGFVAKASGRLSQPEIRASIERYIPLGTAGSPDDIAYAMLYLASNEARWMTGRTLVLDGGMTLPESGQVMEETWDRN